jgi:hypothetical protein
VVFAGLGDGEFLYINKKVWIESLLERRKKKNVSADHKVVNPQPGSRKRETVQATEVCVAAMFVGQMRNKR